MVRPASTGTPRRVVGRTVALAATTLLAAGLLVASPPSVSGFGASSAEATLWQLLNADRTNNGVAALTRNATLVDIARWRSKDMVDRDYFSHTIQGTSYLANHWYNLNGLKYKSWGENIAWNSGYTDAESPIHINAWLMASTTHRHNILNPAFTHGGVGAYGADGVPWLGSVRSPRVYTELFMVASSGSPTQPKPAAKPAAKPASSGPSLHTAASTPPSPGAPLDGWTLLVEQPPGFDATVLRALRDLDPSSESTWSPGSPALNYRVERVGSPRRGILDLLLGGRLEFLLG